MSYLVKRVFVALLVLFSFGLGFAQDELDVAELESAFLQTLPFGWTLVEFNVEAQENYGTSVEPDIRTRFNAVVELTVDTFASVEQDGAVTFLRPVAETGERRIFFGIAASMRSQGGWQTTFDLENNPTVEIGEPRDFFSGRLIVLGSEEEAQYRAQLEAEAQAVQEAELARLSREEELRAQARATELAETAHEVALQATEQEAERVAEVARLAHEAEMRAAVRAQEAAERAAREEELAVLTGALPNEITAQVALQLPGHWTLGELTLGEAVLSGSYDAPILQHSFEATATLDTNTFRLVEENEQVTLVARIEEAGATRTLYGTAVSELDDDLWEVEIDFESLEGLEVGLPLDQFSGQVIMQGSEEEAAYVAQLEQAAQVAHEAELAALARAQELRAAERAVELAEIEAERAAELAEIEHEAQLDETFIAAREAQHRAFQAALESEDRAERLAAIESALVAEDSPSFGAAIRAALESGDSRLETLGLRKLYEQTSSIHLTATRGDDSYRVVLANLSLDPNTGELQGIIEGQSRWGFDCGDSTGVISSGEVSLGKDSCQVVLRFDSTSGVFVGSVLSSNGFGYEAQAPYPGSLGSIRGED